MRTFNWKAALIILAAAAIAWALWQNSLLNGYNDRIKGCEFNKQYLAIPDARGWATAEHRTHTQAQKDLTQHRFVPIYHAIHTAMDHYNAVPCRDRIRAPGILG